MPEFTQDYTALEFYSDGRVRPMLKLTLTPDENEKARSGYLCFTGCGEDWSGTDIQAWPERCPVCSSPDNTAEEYARLFIGVRESGSQIDWDEEEERLERQAYQARTGLWVPDNYH